MPIPTPAELLDLEMNDPTAHTAARARVAEFEKVQTILGPLASANARAALATKLLLALLEGTEPDPGGVTALRTAFDLIETSSVKDVILE